MQIEMAGKTRTITLNQTDRRLRCDIDGRTLDVDAAELSPGTYSILISGKSLDARVEADQGKLRIYVAGQEYAAIIRDPRSWQRKQGRGPESAERRQIVAPMPGKIIRVLLKPGDRVETGQGVVVVEAMKMQNEVRSPKSGTIDRISVAEGQAVSAGDVLAIVA